MIVKYGDDFFRLVDSGGISAVNHTVAHPDKGLDECLIEINRCRQWVEANSARAILAERVADIREAKSQRKVAVIMGLQNARAIEDSLGFLDILHDLGVRVMQLTYQRQNFVGSGCGERSDGGLTLFGLDVVKRMNEIGMVIDLSHCGIKTTADAIRASDDPVICSHSHPYALTQHIRNKSDDLIRAMADKGGVLGITIFSPISYLVPGERPSIVDLVTHIDYVANLVGIDHVGIGTDTDESVTREKWAASRDQYPEIFGHWSYDDRRAEGFSSDACFPEITKALVAQGYSDGDVAKVLGGNSMRVLEHVWDRM